MAAFGLSRLIIQFPRLAEWLMAVALFASLFSVAQRSLLYLLGVTGYIIALLLYLLFPRVQMIVTRQWAYWWRARQMASQMVSRRRLYAVCLGSFVVAVPLLLLLQQIHTQQQQVLYGELPTLISQSSAPGETILAIATHQSYLAQATSLQRRVFHLSHAFATTDAFHAWLVKEQISLIIIGPLRPEWQEEPLVLAVTDPTAPYTLIWDGWESHPRLYQFRLP